MPQKVTPLTPTSPLQSIPASAIAGGYRSRAAGEHAADDPLAPRNTIMQVNSLGSDFLKSNTFAAAQ